MSSSTFELRLATQPVLEDIAREGARRMLQHAIEQEVAGYIDAHQQAVDAAGHRLVVRNGHKPPRTIKTGCGPIEVRQPRVVALRPPRLIQRPARPAFAHRQLLPDMSDRLAATRRGQPFPR